MNIDLNDPALTKLYSQTPEEMVCFFEVKNLIESNKISETKKDIYFQIAVLKNFRQLACLLIKHGVNVNQTANVIIGNKKTKSSMLQISILLTNKDMFSILLVAGANPFEENEALRSPLFFSINYSDMFFIKRIIEVYGRKYISDFLNKNGLNTEIFTNKYHNNDAYELLYEKNDKS